MKQEMVELINMKTLMAIGADCGGGNILSQKQCKEVAKYLRELERLKTKSSGLTVTAHNEDVSKKTISHVILLNSKCIFVGDDDIIDIRYHYAIGDGDQHYIDIYHVDGRIHRMNWALISEIIFSGAK